MFNGSKFSILIVDDFSENLAILDSMLKNVNYVVHQAQSGEEALKILLKVKIDFVLLDVCMPTISGIQTAALIRKHKKFCDLPIIFLTDGDHDNETILEAYELNAIDFIFKPISPEVLLSKIRILLSVLAKKEALILQEQRQKEIIKAHAVDLSKITSEIESVKNSLDEFTYIASHDLREPMRGIHSYARFLLEDYQDIIPEEGVKRLNVILDLSERQDKQIEALLEYSKIGRGSGRQTEFELSSLVKNVKADLCAIMERDSASIEIASELPAMVGDTAAISRIFYNLIANGIKYNKSEKK